MRFKQKNSRGCRKSMQQPPQLIDKICEKSAQKSMVYDRFRNRHLYAPLGADGRPRQHSALLTAWLVRGFLPLPRTAGAKTNLPMCLRRCESSSLGRFAELFLTCLNLSAAEVPCETAPFASFSGRTEKEGPARPERVPIYEIVLVHFDKTISLFGRLRGCRENKSACNLYFHHD